MPWIVEFVDDFKTEFSKLDDEVKVEIRALTNVLKQLGPSYGRPRVDTLNDTKHANMKELRFDAADGVWRVRSLSTLRGKRFFSSPETSLASAKNASTRS
ncbi:type II toxin-antitoxin system RelE/ParE family toxin [Mesorhizobium escarrei]|uniref:Addiction module toxin RelE n=1 Tax=Mesorhizobium escarrei TaxID=666018 RepID=A0ABM9E968_9HYPH|nr:hypothetical protein MES5069_490013 [Mesorhizobium escarrei]